MDQNYVYTTAAIIGVYLVFGMFRKSFDPFAPVWLFLAGYAQVYVFQAISHRDYALEARGLEVVTAANFRALWALAWFLLVYHCGISRGLARGTSPAPRGVVGPAGPGGRADPDRLGTDQRRVRAQLGSRTRS